MAQQEMTEAKMGSHRVAFAQAVILLVSVLASLNALADEPKPTPENTIHVEPSEAVKPQTFSRGVKFFVGDVTDRSGNAQPMLVFKPRGGIFLDRTPTEIMREGLTTCLKSADLLATDQESADFILMVYLFHFGLSDSSGMDFFGKVEFAAMVKNPKTGKSEQVQSSGTSIAGVAVRKKNIQKNVLENINKAFGDALRNFLRGEKLRNAVNALDIPAETRTPAAAEKPLMQR
ncbi:MAG TPA: hypothetical protein VER56_01895 [Candidatus Eisenbacteria bacterium]|nr:hypothetical protein [Candidatus Eisenbacteria bacterium]